MLIFMFGPALFGGIIYVYDLVAGGGSAGDYPTSFESDEAQQRFRWCEQSLTKVYKEHNPAKIPGVPALCVKYKGKEKALLRKVVSKYESDD